MEELRLDFSPLMSTGVLASANAAPDLPLRSFLERFPARVAEPLPLAWLDRPLREFRVRAWQFGPEAVPALPLPDLRAELAAIREVHAPVTPSPALPSPVPLPPISPYTPSADAFPTALTDSEAVARAYRKEISKIGRYLGSDLAVLVVCDKVLAEHVYRHAVNQSGKNALLEQGATGGEEQEGGMFQSNVAGPGTRIAALGRQLAAIKANEVLVLRHLDTLAGSGPEGPLSQEARLLTEVLYRSQEFTPTLLGFADPSLGLPKVLTDRFAVRIELAGLGRDVIPSLVTMQERERFAPFDAETLFKNVSGFNAIQLRNAMRYLFANSQPATPTTQLMNLIREFKRGSSEEVEIPDVSFNEIGGYEKVKRELFEAIELITGKPTAFSPDGSPRLVRDETALHPESDAERARRRKLAPRGFIFHGPPGTGKTLFAKAIANAMNATIQMVSGPEIMDMWVGKSESNLRRLFTVARRNAPAVIFFDEFDSIAAQRGGSSDGGSRASNAVVAQLLSEIDGFHADQDILVIGTTNRLDIIDEALLRPSRFQPIHIDLPDEAARRKIAAIHARSFEVPMADDLHLLDLIAQHTDQFNGDEIRAIFQEIARMARRGMPISAESYGVQIGMVRKRRDERLMSHIGSPRRR